MTQNQTGSAEQRLALNVCRAERLSLWFKQSAAAAAPLGKHSAPSKEGVPLFGRIVLLVMINGFATSRTKSNMNPPSAAPDVTETGT
jgi:hypothetical protein